MMIRILAAVVLLPLLLAVVLFLPKVCTALLFGVMCAIAVRELLLGTGLVKHKRLVIYGMIMAFFAALWSGQWSVYALALLGIFSLFVILAIELLMFHSEMRFEEFALTFFAGCVLPFLLCAVVRIHSWAYGRVLILLPFVISFASDTGAYFIGCFFGKHKLAPNISPKKTVEGLAGGVAGAIVGVVIYCLVMKFSFGFAVNYYSIPLYGILGSFGAVLGDLCFSVVKRQTGIKDYGNLIPGHGGILDRFDSMIVVAPLVEVLMLYVPMVVK